MSNWISYPIKLTGQIVDLLPLEQVHFYELSEIAHEKRIWEHYTYDGSDPIRFREVFNEAQVEKDKGSQFPFVIYDKHNKIIGSTRFMDIQPKHKKLEIGSTWLHPDFWGTSVNPECKLLLFTYCFETVHAVRVQLKTDENNLRSRKAIEKIGGKFEGILRNEMLRDNNTQRNSAYYSLTNDEWKHTKIQLNAMVLNKMKY